jgi:hypothetical protein
MTIGTTAAFSYLFPAYVRETHLYNYEIIIESEKALL